MHSYHCVRCMSGMLALLLIAAAVSGATYHVDATNGSDLRSGTSPDSAWKSLAPVRTKAYQPRDTVKFKRGCAWTGGLSFSSRSGTSGSPIVLTAYGSGERPILRNPGQNTVLGFSGADWWVVDNLKIQECDGNGINLSTTCDHVVLQNLEVTNTGYGVWLEGTYNILTRSYIHDLHMIVNTPGGDDDFGAAAVVLSRASNLEVSYNTMRNCEDTSFDYGHDGGVVETWRSVSDCRIHHNYGVDCNGFFEAGGQAGDTVADMTFSYNLCVDNGSFMVFHTGGSSNFTVGFANIKAENNTVVQTSSVSRLIAFYDAAPTDAAIFQFRNNIFHVQSMNALASSSVLTHAYNLYYEEGGTTNPGFTLGTGEKSGNPLFVSLTNRDFHLQAASPAKDAGTVLGYSTDFDTNTVPFGTAPDMGAFEYRTGSGTLRGERRTISERRNPRMLFPGNPMRLNAHGGTANGADVAIFNPAGVLIARTQAASEGGAPFMPGNMPGTGAYLVRVKEEGVEQSGAALFMK